MSGQVLSIAPGSRLSFDGDVVEVVAVDGVRVTIRSDRTRQFTAVQISRLAASARPAGGTLRPGDDGVSPGLALGSLTSEQLDQLAERAGHVREVLTGYKSGHPDRAGPGEPRPGYRAGQPLKARYRAKAEELGITSRTVERWVAAYRGSGEAGLAGVRALRGRGTAVDPRWDEAVRLVLAEMVSDSTPTRSAVLRKAGARLDELHGAGAVPRPSAATAYRRLAELARGTNAVSGSAKGRRSIADRPTGAYGRLRAMRPGEYAILDTQDLDVFAMEPVTCRWVRTQLTVVQDLFTRCITGLRVTPVSTKAVDVAGVLFQAIAPRPAPRDWPEEACWAYHGVPQQLVFTGEGRLPGVPACPPETLVIDHGKAFLSAHVISVCTRLGISIQPAQPKKPTDKPTCERFFKTLREGLIQHLPAYKGPDIYSRGEHVEDAAFLFTHELEDVITEWVALVELHNLDMGTRAGAEASDTLKYFSERLPATFVYAGIGLDRGALLAGPRGAQVAGRFTLIPTSAFSPGQEWITLVAALDSSLRLYHHRGGELAKLADYLHRRTRGVIGSLLWLVRDAANQAIIDGTEKITRKSLDVIAVDMTAQAPAAQKQARKP